MPLNGIRVLVGKEKNARNYIFVYLYNSNYCFWDIYLVCLANGSSTYSNCKCIIRY